ncbi:hypothetical protein Rcas_1921 [Roseiflexus castenholzii DSM 13941]|uniref:Uncharacterized protein n=1 Tax=Roseiflexus castenholzii (strain DSM 13941 / HLO8) TaxID=383372 RepID=A7NKJ1_ROSCS|nr:hypothetical protein Rcas_1921 [Roseiflexus castenholzii DSM 13941]
MVSVLTVCFSHPSSAPAMDAALRCGIPDLQQALLTLLQQRGWRHNPDAPLLAMLDAPFGYAPFIRPQEFWYGNLPDSRSLPDDCRTWRRSSIISSERAPLQGRVYF